MAKQFQIKLFEDFHKNDDYCTLHTAYMHEIQY